MLGQRDVFGRSTESPAVALAVKKPDPLAHAEPRDAVTELIDDAGTVAVGYHSGKFQRAIAAGAAADIGGIDPGGLQPYPDFARTGHRRRHVAKGQYIGRGTGSLVPNGLHSQRARKCAAIEQDVLPGDVACLGAAEKRASPPEFLGIAEASGRIELGAFGQQLVDRDAALLRVDLCDRAAQAVSIERSRQQAVDGDVVDYGLARNTCNESGEAGAGAVGQSKHLDRRLYRGGSDVDDAAELARDRKRT